MAVSNTNIQWEVKEWLDKGLSNDDIAVELGKRGFDERSLPEMMAEIKRLRNARKTSSGLILILIGGVVCLLSCILTMTSSYSHTNFEIVLYGFTTLGILIVFGGLMKIFN
ncbi:MAG: hypothetical protein JST82_03145 [Bacteroidetes bacterium]|nr:hypothetical protein [Bacteroidota bacterium]